MYTSEPKHDSPDSSQLSTSASTFVTRAGQLSEEAAPPTTSCNLFAEKRPESESRLALIEEQLQALQKRVDDSNPIVDILLIRSQSRWSQRWTAAQTIVLSITLGISIWLAISQAQANKTADRAARTADHAANSASRAADSADSGVRVALQALQAANDANRLAEKQNNITSAQTAAAESEVMMMLYDYCLDHEQVKFDPSTGHLESPSFG